jgi:hypothetical protein
MVENHSCVVPYTRISECRIRIDSWSSWGRESDVVEGGVSDEVKGVADEESG